MRKIAGLALVRRCQRAILFEGSRVARRQEAGTRLFERAVTTITDTAVCINTPCAVARRAEAAELRRNRRAVD
ncbi:hypothetical protein IHE49_11200 [Rhodanobacter sp. 7MK24]|nr:hypothetical protein [Rhodanobacter sp. 7MK24]MBD8881045.1 hypothetical protein [Rhodanobacter sp. 7MK24]